MNHVNTNNKDPDLLALTQKALNLLSNGNKQEALDILDKLPFDVVDASEELLQSMGVLAFNLGQYARSIALLSRLVVKQPDNVDSLDKLAVAYIASGRSAEAMYLLNRVLAINPDHAYSLINLGKLYIDDDRHVDAIKVLERARKDEPNNVTLLINLAIAYNHIGRLEEALETIQKAAKLEPNTPSINRLIGAIHLQTGNAEEAIKYYKKELALSKYSGLCYWGIASSRRATEADRAFIAEMEALLEGSMPAQERGFICFAVAKMYDDLKMWDKAFEHFRMGNTLRKSATKPVPPYRFAKNIQRACTPKLTKPDIHVGNTSDKPIFILGMPRTGSTLTEQIISSHPLAASAGELRAMHEITAAIFTPDDKPFSEMEAALSSESLKKYADQYLAILCGQGRSDAIRVIDKSPGNFFQIGLILLLFPNARFIHTIRHPLDTLLSCYFQPFASVVWSQDMTWQAEAYQIYRETMAYWQKTLPPGRILDVHYETLTADPENESKRIMEYCGLDWQPSCLDFFRKEGSVRTASTWQVRQPIYQTSKMRWVNYAPYLKQLAEDISPYLTESDMEIFRQQGITIKRKNPVMTFIGKLFN